MVRLLQTKVTKKCQRDRSVASAYQTALKKKDDMAIALALSPFARKTAELVKSGSYEVDARGTGQWHQLKLRG